MENVHCKEKWTGQLSRRLHCTKCNSPPTKSHSISHYVQCIPKKTSLFSHITLSKINELNKNKISDKVEGMMISGILFMLLLAYNI